MDVDYIPRMITYLVSMLMCLTVHEYAHAAVAFWLGDDTASSQGRMSLNPLVHIDPIGTIAMPVIGSISGVALFGWAKPVPTNPVRYSRRFRGKRISMNAGLAMVAAAGPLSNLVFALVLAMGLRLISHVFPPIDAQMPGYTLAMRVLVVNVGLFVFNLLPLPPLDGSRIVYWLMRDKHRPIMDLLARNTPLVFIGMLLLMQTRWFGAVMYVPIGLIFDGLNALFDIQPFFRFL
ncbi:MAG: site-2 protease family protein [Pseudomonadota bacterium]